MLEQLRTWWLRQTYGVRDTWWDLYRHYQMERQRIERLEQPRSPEDRIILDAITRARQDQHDRMIEGKVRRFHEASRFVTRKPTDQT